jgi:hypothetical protein
MTARGANHLLARAGDPAAIERRNLADRARQRGYRDARRLGRLLDAARFASRSNQCTVDGQHVIIKTAATRTRRIELTLGTRERAEAVIAAFELAPGFFEVWHLSMDTCETIGIPGRRQRLQVTRGAARRVGRRIGWWDRRGQQLIPAMAPKSCTAYGSNVRIDPEEPILG